MKIGIRVPPSESLRDVIAVVREADAQGLAHAWFPDSHLNYRDVWTVLGAAAGNTERIGLGPGVTNLSTRHPSVTASAAASLAESIGERFVLGLGAGDSAIGHNGLQHSSTSQLRDGIAELRRWMAGTPSVDEPGVKLRHGGSVPQIYLAASGPANLRLAGEVADGVITPLARLSEKIRVVEDAAASAGRPGAVEIVANAMCLVTDDLERDAMLLAPFVIRTAQMEGTALFRKAGIELHVPDHVVGAVGDVGHPDQIGAAVNGAATLVSREAAMFYARTCALAGTPVEIARALADLERWGVGRVNVATLPGLPWALIDALRAAANELARIESRPSRPGE